MATRTIPNDVRPYWSCTVNGKKYTYESGATVDVPDGVAAVIDAINEGKKRPEPAYVPTLPVITEADEGKVLKVVGGKWVLVEGGGGGVFETNITLSADPETGKRVVTTDKTAEEFFDAIETGKAVVALFTVPGPEETAISVRKILPIVGLCVEGAVYEFTFVEADSDDGVIAFATDDELLPGDTVVFHKV